jgi:hypothetical protein
MSLPLHLGFGDQKDGMGILEFWPNVVECIDGSLSKSTCTMYRQAVQYRHCTVLLLFMKLIST